MGGLVNSRVAVSVEPKYEYSYIVKFTAPNAQNMWKTTELELWCDRKGEDVGMALVNFVKRRHPYAIIYSVKYV